jgi:hypothetical protein
MRENYANTKLKRGRWMILDRISGSRSQSADHNLWHQCKPHDPDIWPVYPTNWVYSETTLQRRTIPLQWRCGMCGKRAVDTIMGAFKLLESDYCVQEEAWVTRPK